MRDLYELSLGEAVTLTDTPRGAVQVGRAGALLAGRYRLVTQLGFGGFGTVWRAQDLLSDEVVAVKAMAPVGGARQERARRELAALRLLRLPGVVRLLDDGHEDDVWFIVMELVAGRAFPGPFPSPCPWDALSDVALGLLETVGRVHEAGIVHRDLKPPNVLVTDDLRPVVLDFGLARGPAMGATITLAGAMVGTPAWLSPEQIRGEPVGAAADLYSLGLMLYRALSGRLPHASGDVRDLWAARASSDAAPLRSVASVPRHVADVVDALLSREPDDRPRSAFEAAEALQRRGGVPRRRIELPWLGPDTAADRLVELAELGRSARLTGPSGVGRSAVLRRAAERIARTRPVLWPAPSTRAFESLAPLLSTSGRDMLETLPAGSLDRVLARVDAALTVLLSGAVVAVDDAEALDGWSRHALIRAAEKGPVLSVDPEGGGEEVHLTPLCEADLRDLFVGTDRLLHEREDAARELHVRTGGLPARVREEVAAWVRAGVATWAADGRLATSRPSLERLAAGLRLAPVWAPVPERRLRSAPESEGLVSSAILRPRAAHRELLAWVALAWPHATAQVLAAATGEPLWRVQAELFELEELQLVVVEGGAAAPTATALVGGAPWSEERRRAAHGRLASLLPQGDARLWHLVAAGAERRLVDEALGLVALRRRAGELGRAAATAVEALAAARAVDDASGAAALVDALVRVALEDGTVAALDRALYEMGRRPAGEEGAGAPHPDTCDACLPDLLRAVRRAATEVGERVLGELDGLGVCEDPELELARQEARVRASRGLAPEGEAAVVGAAVAWAREAGHPVVAELWEGMLLYRQARYEEAGAQLSAAAAKATSPLQRLAALEDAAAAWIEAGRDDEAAAAAAKARVGARALRLPLLEGRAEWLERTALYRSGASLRPDLELVTAAESLGMPHFLAQVCFSEAAVALRCGDRPAGSVLATRAAHVWTPAGRRWEAALARALAVACGASGDIEALLGEAEACPVQGFAVQIAGLLALGGHRPRRLLELVRNDTTPPPRRARRIDVLSVDECVAAAEDTRAE